MDIISFLPCKVTVGVGTHQLELKIKGYVTYSNKMAIVSAGKTIELHNILLLPKLIVVDNEHTVTVNTLEDKARWTTFGEMNSITVASLKSNSSIPVSLREAIEAVKNEPVGNGHYRIEFALSLKGGTIHLFDHNYVVPDGFLQNLYLEKRGNLTINGDIDRDGNQDITLDASKNGKSGTPTGSILSDI